MEIVIIYYLLKVLGIICYGSVFEIFLKNRMDTMRTQNMMMFSSKELKIVKMKIFMKIAKAVMIKGSINDKKPVLMIKLKLNSISDGSNVNLYFASVKFKDQKGYW